MTLMSSIVAPTTNIRISGRIFAIESPIACTSIFSCAHERTGANEATLISFSKDVLFAGQPVKAGQYSLFTIPAESAWTVILNRQTGQWGLTYPGPASDLGRVKMTMSKPAALVEQLKYTITDKGAGMSKT